MLLWAALAEVEEAVEPGIRVLVAVELDTQAVAVVRYDTQAAAVEERDTPAVAVVEHDTRASAVAVAEHDTRASAGAECCTQVVAAAEEEEELVASYLVAAPCTLSADGGRYHQRFHHFPNSSWSCSLLVTCPEPMLSRQRPAPGLTHPRPLRRLLSGAAIA